MKTETCSSDQKWSSYMTDFPLSVLRSVGATVVLEGEKLLVDQPDETKREFCGTFARENRAGIVAALRQEAVQRKFGLSTSAFVNGAANGLLVRLLDSVNVMESVHPTEEGHEAGGLILDAWSCAYASEDARQVLTEDICRRITEAYNRAREAYVAWQEAHGRQGKGLEGLVREAIECREGRRLSNPFV